jgi:hypothetical protein
VDLCIYKCDKVWQNSEDITNNEKDASNQLAESFDVSDKQLVTYHKAICQLILFQLFKEGTMCKISS